MADSSNKLYSPDEIRELLKRATAMEKGEKNAPETGLTLDEIEQIASESGIDPSYIRRAAEEQGEQTTAKRGFYWLGGPLTLDAGRVVHSRLTPSVWETVVREMRRETGQTGTVQEVGNSQEWASPPRSARGQFVETSLTASPSGDQTRLFMRQNFKKAAFFTYYLSTLILSLVTITLADYYQLPADSIFGVIALVAATGFLGVRYGFGAWLKSRNKRMNRILDRFQELLGRGGKTGSAADTAEISIEDPDPEQDDVRTSGGSRSRSRTRNRNRN